MAFVFNDIKVVSQGMDNNSVVTRGYLDNNYIKSGDSDISFNNFFSNRLINIPETNVITLNNNISRITGTSNILPDGSDNLIGFEKILINENENVVSSIFAGAFTQDGGQTINSFAFDNSGNLYVAGRFVTYKDKVVNNIFRYNTDGTFSRCAMGTQSEIQQIVWDSSYNRLYVGGAISWWYTSEGTTFVCNGAAIYYPDTDTWGSFGTTGKTGGTGMSSSTSGRFLIDYQNNYLYVCNNSTSAFTSLGGVTVKSIARVNRANLTDIVSVINTTTYPISSALFSENNMWNMLLDNPNNKLYVCGNHTGSNGIFNNLSQIDITTVPSSTINPIGLTAGFTGTATGGLSGSFARVRSMVMVGDDIYFGGDFNRTPSSQYTGNSLAHLANSVTLQRFAKFNKNTLVISPINIDSYIDNTILDLRYDAIRNKILIVGGFTWVGGMECRGLCWYNVSTGQYEQLTYGFNFARDPLLYNNININFSMITGPNEYIIAGLLGESTGSDNNSDVYIKKLDISKINYITGNIINNGIELSQLQMVHKGQMYKLIWNGNRWCVDNYLKV